MDIIWKENGKGEEIEWWISNKGVRVHWQTRSTRPH